jgi:hypothetical protein
VVRDPADCTGGSVRQRRQVLDAERADIRCCARESRHRRLLAVADALAVTVTLILVLNVIGSDHAR